MIYVKLFTNAEEWVSPNEIVEAVDYEPCVTMAATLGKKSFLFDIKSPQTIYGVYLINREGDLLYHQRFDTPFGNGYIKVSFSSQS